MSNTCFVHTYTREYLLIKNDIFSFSAKSCKKSLFMRFHSVGYSINGKLSSFTQNLKSARNYAEL